MATYFLDPVGGSDANAGTSFATRWQSLNGGATNARIAPGDTIRVIESKPPTSLGDGTWTDGSRTVTLANAVTAEITPATAAWTPVTNTSSTTNTNRKVGAASSSLSVASTFTTGKSHYTTVTTSDLSAYQQITFWIMQTSGTLASGNGEIRLSLCSDTTGSTPIYVFNIPRIRALNQWQAFTIDNGAPLDSAIQSIAFHVNTDRAAQTFLINHVLAVKAPSAADSLSLTSLISKNSGSEGWYAIESINGTTVTLATAGINYNLSAAGTPAGYSGASETVTTYKREPLMLPSAFVSSTFNSIVWGSVQDSGSAGSPITFSGGWNSTDMSTQTGDTYVSGVNGFGVCFYLGGMSYVTMEKLSPVNFAYGYWVNAASDNVNITAKDISCNSYVNVYVQSQSAGGPCPTNLTITADNINCAGNGAGSGITLNRAAKNVKLTAVNMNSNWNYGFTTLNDSTSTFNPWIVSMVKANVTNLKRNGTFGAFLAHLDNGDLSFGSVQSNGSNGLRLQSVNGTLDNAGVANTRFRITGTLIGNGGDGVAAFGARNCTLDLTDASVVGNGGAGVNFLKSTGCTVVGGTFAGQGGSDIEADGGADVTVIGGLLGSASPYNLWENGSSKITFHDFQETAGDHRTYTTSGSILTDTATRHTASGSSRAISPTSTTYVTQDFPMVLPVARVAVAADSLVTASVWVYRSDIGITTKLVAKGGLLAGVPSDVVATASGSAGSWEQLTVTFTSSETGVIELEVQAYGGTTHTVYVDDFDVTQA